MSYYEDHKKAVAGRMAKKLKEGKSQSLIERTLRRYGWSYSDTQEILKMAIKIFERSEN